MQTVKKRRKIITDLDADAKKAEARAAHKEIGGSGLYPLDAPGMPLPGPDFMEHARNLGDLSDFKKVKVEGQGKKKTDTVLDSIGDKLVELHRRALREPGFTMPIQTKPGMRKSVPFVPGHIWGQYMKEYEAGDRIAVDGPRPADVMVLGKMPGKTEVQEGRNMVGESGKLLIDVIREHHIKGSPNWYVTNVLKFQPPDSSGTIKAPWLKDCMPLLHQELRIVRPKYILCLGADASKALLGPKYGVDYMDGRVMELEYPVHMEATDDPDKVLMHKALVMTVVHPAAVVRAPEQRRRLERGMARFAMLQNGIRFDKEEVDIDHRTIRTLEQLQALLHEIDHDPYKKDDWISFDAEWNGEHPQNKGSYVRTMQLAWRPKHAAAIIWSDTTGKFVFCDEDGKPAKKRAIKLLNEWFATKRITMHFGVADLEWMQFIGLTELAKRYRVPLYDKFFGEFEKPQRKKLRKMGFAPGDLVPAWVRTHFEGGHDTGLAGHAIEETAQLGLEVLAMRYTTCPRYDIPLHNWKEAFCKEKGYKAKDLEGYGPCPDEIIVPYGCYDADATLRLMYEQLPLIDNDYEGNCCRESFWESMLTVGPILEMHCTGIPVDRKRIDFLTAAFMKARAEQEEKIRKWARWPEFNIRSVTQVREFLFGEKYNGKKTPTGDIVSVRPRKGVDGAKHTAKSLYLEPILDTSKPPKAWFDIKDKGLEHEHTPGTGKTILGVLAQENQEQSEYVQWIRDYRFLDQVLKSVLRPPVVDKDGEVVRDETAEAASSIDASTGQEASPYSFGRDNLGGVVYDAGLAAVICGDGRVRTHLYPTTETKRWRSARPNLQNMSKRRDPDYTRLLGGTKNEKGKWVGGDYKYKLRSLLHAIPGHVLVEADFIGAELYLMAVMSGDPTMIEHATRNQLPEDDPLYYDIHSNVAVLAFNLKCEPTKKGLESIGKVSLRIAAKNVIFGVAYGRQAKAIALQCKEEGNPITVQQAQIIIDIVFQLYPGLKPFFTEAQQRSKDPRWICSCFGAFRRFPQTDDFSLQGEFERQAMNFGIQSGIASAMDRALAYMEDYRNNTIGDPDFFKFALQIHDAVLLHVPYANVERVVEDVLPYNLTKRVEIYPTTLDGVPTGEGPYHLGIDTEIFDHWGEPLTPNFCEEHGIPLKYAKGKAA